MWHYDSDVKSFKLIANLFEMKSPNIIGVSMVTVSDFAEIWQRSSFQ